MEKEKKKWETPKLICLYRGRAEEAVLQQCKQPGQSGPTPPKTCGAWFGVGCSTRDTS